MKIESNDLLNFLDQSAQEDSMLKMFTTILGKMHTHENLEHFEVVELSAFIRNYLNLKIVREHYYFKRSLSMCNLNEDEIKRELSKFTK
jgi:hypothetical protein